MHKTTLNFRNQVVSILILTFLISFGISNAQSEDYTSGDCTHTGTVLQIDPDVGSFQIHLDNGQWILPVASSVPDFFSDSLRVRVGFEFLDDTIGPCLSCSYVYLTCARMIEDTMYCKARFEAYPLDYLESSTEVAGWYIWEFVDVSIGNVIDRFWYIDGDTIYGEPSFTYTFKEAGYHSVCLVIITEQGCTDSYCSEIYVGGGGDCYADFDYYPLFGIVEPATGEDMYIALFPYQFINKSIGKAVHWEWKIGDDVISGDPDPVYNFPYPGEYEVCLTIVTSDSCVSTQCKTVVVGPPFECKAMFEYYSLQIVLPSEPDPDFPGARVFKFIDMSKGNISDWYWDFGDGTYSKEQNPIHGYLIGGEYEVCLTVSSPDGCQDTYCTKIIVDPWWDCNAYFEYCPYHISSPVWRNDTSALIIGFKNLSIPNAVYSEWDFGDGTHSTEHDPMHIYHVPGVYQVCLSVYTASGCFDKYCTDVYVGVSECKVDFLYEIIVPKCWGYETAHYFSAITATVPRSYSWDFGDGHSASEAEVIHTYANEGFFDVCLEVTYADGCKAKECKLVFNSNSVNDSIYFEKCNPDNLDPAQSEQPLSVTKVYPVPASDILNIDLYSESSSTIDISLINIVGQRTSLSEIHDVFAGDNQLVLHLGTLEPGTYIYMISSSDTVIRGRVSIIQ